MSAEWVRQVWRALRRSQLAVVARLLAILPDWTDAAGALDTAWRRFARRVLRDLPLPRVTRLLSGLPYWKDAAGAWDAALSEERQPYVGYAGSIALHGLVIAATLITFSHGFSFRDQPVPTVPIDLVTLSDETNVTPSVQPAPRIERQDVPAPAPPPVVESQNTPSPQSDTETPPPTDDFAQEPLKNNPPPAPSAKPQITTTRENTNSDVHGTADVPDKAAPARTDAPIANRTVQGVGDQTAMTTDLQAMLLNMIKPCWSPPVNAPNAEEQIVDFDVRLNPDGSIARQPQLIAKPSGASTSPFARAAAESALRAIYTCAPFRLPADQYSKWHEISDFRVDAQLMMGR